MHCTYLLTAGSIWSPQGLLSLGMRVLFYNHTGKISGGERVLLLALARLDRTRFDATAVCPAGPLADAIEANGITRIEIDEFTPQMTLRPDRLVVSLVSLAANVISLRSVIRSAAPELIHANSIRAGIAALFASIGTKIPVVWHIHDELKPHPLTSAIRQIARSSRFRGVAVSKATAITFAGPVRGLNVAVVHNGVDLSEIDNAPKVDVRQELGFDAGSFVFGLIGQITPRKGQLELIEAFAKVSPSMPEARLILVGSPMFERDDSYFEQLRMRISQLGLLHRVRFLGQRSDAIGIMKDLNAVVVNSKSEAFVLVAIEAMACGTPVIATDVGGTREMVRNDETGILVPSDDQSRLVSAMKTVYASAEARKRYRTNGRRLVEQYLNTDRFIEELEAVLIKAGPNQSEATLPSLPASHAEQGT